MPCGLFDGGWAFALPGVDPDQEVAAELGDEIGGQDVTEAFFEEAGLVWSEAGVVAEGSDGDVEGDDRPGGVGFGLLGREDGRAGALYQDRSGGRGVASAS